MKSKTLHIASFLMLVIFFGLLMLSSNSILNLEEENEELIEIVLDDFFDEEGVFDSKLFPSNLIVEYLTETELKNSLLHSHLHLIRNYSSITESIPVPPPKK